MKRPSLVSAPLRATLLAGLVLQACGVPGASAASAQPSAVPPCDAPALPVEAACTSRLGHRVEAPRLVSPDALPASSPPPLTLPVGEGLDADALFARYCEVVAGESIHREVSGTRIVVDMRPPWPPVFQLRTDARKRLRVRLDHAQRWLPALLAEEPWLIEDVLAVWNGEEGPGFATAVLDVAGIDAMEVPQRPLPPPPERPRQRPYPAPPNQVPDDTLPPFLREPVRRLPDLPQQTWARVPISGGDSFPFLAPVPRLGIRARYGFERRGLDLPGAREAGIAGREVRVVDLDTGELLAEQRALFRFPPLADAVAAEVCPAEAAGPEALARFLGRVLSVSASDRSSTP